MPPSPAGPGESSPTQPARAMRDRRASTARGRIGRIAAQLGGPGLGVAVALTTVSARRWTALGDLATLGPLAQAGPAPAAARAGGPSAWARRGSPRGEAWQQA